MLGPLHLDYQVRAQGAKNQAGVALRPSPTSVPPPFIEGSNATLHFMFAERQANV
jgi:hypothetical protein